MPRKSKGGKRQERKKGQADEEVPKAKTTKTEEDGPSYHDVIQAFYRILDQITEQGNTTTINNSVLEAALDLVKAPFGLVGEVDPDGTFKVVAVLEKGKPMFDEPIHDRLMARGMPFRGYLAKILNEGDPRIENEPGKGTLAAASDLLKGHPMFEFPIANLLFVPFKVMGSIVGAIILGNKPGGFTENDKALMFELARMTSIGRSKILALSAAMRNTTDGIALMDRNGVLSMVNPAMEQMFHYTASELEGRSLLGIFLDPDTGSPLGEAIAGAVMNGTWGGEALGLRRDGTMFPVHMTVTVIEEETAPRTGFMLMARDITNEKEVADRAKLYLETADVILLALDLDGKVTMINKKGEEVLGRTRGDVVGKDWFGGFVPEAHRSQAHKDFEKIFESSLRGAVGPMGAPPARQLDGTVKGFDMAKTGHKEAYLEGNLYPIVDSHGRERTIQWGYALLKNYKGLVVGALLSGSDITEQRTVEERLRASENLYKTILKLSPDAIIMSDVNGVIQDVSQRAIEIYGTEDPYDMIGKSSFDFIHPDDKDKALRGLQRTMKEGSVKANFQLRRKTGAYYPAELTTTIVKDQEGRITGFLGIVKDLSERELAATRLKEAKERFQNVFENSPVGIMRIGLTDKKPIMANKVAAEQMGYTTVQEFLDKFELDGLMPEKRVAVLVERIKRQGHLKDYEMEYNKADGTKTTVLLNATLTPEADFIDIFGIDISKAKEMESKLNEVERAFGGILDATFLGFTRFNIKDGKLSYANKRLAKRFGYNTVEEFLENMTSRDMFTDAQRMEIKAKLLKDGVLPNYETEVRTKDGTKLWALTYSRLDKATGYIDVMSIDITKMKEAEERSREAEQMYKALFDTIPTGVVKIDMATSKMTMANEAVASMFGYGSIPEFIEAFHKNEVFWPGVKKIMASLEERGTLTSEEHSFPRKDATRGFIEITATLDREKGEATFFAVDVSQSKALENRLREAEQLYRHLFDNTPVGVSRIRIADFTIVLANRAILDILGASSIDEMNIPANKMNFYPMDMVEEGIEQLKTMGAESGVELEVTRVDGGKRVVLVYVTLDTTGEYMDNVVMDITRLKEAESRLNEAESTYWQMFKASTVGQARVAMEDGKVQVCNEAFARMLGYQSVEQLVREFDLGKHLKDMDLWATKVASKAAGGKGVGWLPSPSSPPSPGAKAQDARTVLIGFIPGVRVPMVRKDGKELTAVVSGVVYMGRGFMDLTFIDTNLIGP